MTGNERRRIWKDAFFRSIFCIPFFPLSFPYNPERKLKKSGTDK
ncbi:hypothetical protein HMPREF1246_1124 [Acidaminococcus sp. BV3L6]|uniref:Uncharacterized protein n=1 Tax=Acidaminococcus intestini (strain RyC-MR95) TaxID=568816 RepID=G4Q8Z3_ACIIR|nr:hypothetical protein Acin_0449 [Acidaminococcus intestini RyC-MR95]ERL18409.1 hypothetical protein HMPREF1246_1124 [Acidaminococcus sp. BV3L6]